MKVNFNRKFKNFKGQETGELIYDKIAEALFLGGANAELPISNENKYKAYKLSQKLIAGKGEVEITSEEATLIKEITANYLVAGAYGQIEEIIEQVK
jgi:hypothetical protein